jgi:2-(1,2-epoxy-1,2-dihydrophenyl)acetyl-CoA isomerase
VYRQGAAAAPRKRRPLRAADFDTLAKQFAQAPTLGLARTKQAIYASPNNALDAQLDLERDFMRELGASADYREGVAAFMEKRTPTFRRF